MYIHVVCTCTSVCTWGSPALLYSSWSQTFTIPSSIFPSIVLLFSSTTHKSIVRVKSSTKCYMYSICWWPDAECVYMRQGLHSRLEFQMLYMYMSTVYRTVSWVWIWYSTPEQLISLWIKELSRVLLLCCCLVVYHACVVYYCIT